MRHFTLCAGLDMRCCVSCQRNVDNNPDVIPEHTLKPAADPPRFADWMSMPTPAIDSTHGGL